MSRNYWLITLLIIGASISLLTTIFLLPKKTTTTQKNTLIAPRSSEISLPVSLEDPSIFAVSTIYTFTGTILSLKTVPEGIEIATDIKSAGVPKFIVCITCEQPTTVFGTFKNGQRQVNYNILSSGQKIRINSSYNMRTKQWQTTNRITILDNLVLPTSPPRNIKTASPSAK